MRLKEISGESVAKYALILLGYLIMGVWMAAQIASGNTAMRDDIKRLDDSVKHLSDRFDKHIDKEK